MSRLLTPALLLLCLAACGGGSVAASGGSGASGTGGSGGAGGKPQENCHDGKDNDGNGFTDCADPACVADPLCRPFCGDHVKGLDEKGKPEDCDKEDLGTATCVSLGFNAGGALSCTSECKYDTSGCFRREDCGLPGDEDGNGAADCADVACASLPRCLHVSLVTASTNPVVTGPATITVKVVGGTGVAISDLAVSLTPPPGASVTQGLASTDAQGLVTFDLRAGRSPGPQIFTVSLDGLPHALDVELDAADAAPGTIHSILNLEHASGEDENGPAIAAAVGPPIDLAVASDGTIFVAEACRVLSITPAGVLARRAGTGTCGAAKDGPALDADLSVASVALDEADGVLLIAASAVGNDPASGRVFALDLAKGTLITAAGGGTKEAPDADGGPASQAALDPSGVAFDPSGFLYITDGRARALRRVDLVSGLIDTAQRAAPRGGPCDDPVDIASCGPGCWPFLDAGGAVFLSAPICGQLTAAPGDSSIDGVVRAGDALTHLAGFAKGPAPIAGPATLALLPGPLHGAFDQAGNLLGATGHALVRIDGVTGRIQTLAGSASPGSAGELETLDMATFSSPGAVAFGPGGDLYIADTGNSSVRRIVALGDALPTQVSLEPVSGDGQQGLMTTLLEPRLTFRVRDGSGAPLAGPVQLRASDPGATVFPGSDSGPDGLAARQVRLGLQLGPHDFEAYVLDIHGQLTGAPARFTLTTLAPDPGVILSVTSPTSDAGNAVLAQSDLLPAPSTSVDVRDVAVASDGTAYLAAGAQVLALRPDGALALVAGTGISGRDGDGGPPEQALISAYRVAYDEGFQTLYLGDQGGEPRVRAVHFRGHVISTFAGGGSGKDGGAAQNAALGSVAALAVGSDHSVYIADGGVRVVGNDEDITTLVPALPCGPGDGLAGGVTALALDGKTLFISGTVCHGGNGTPGVLRRDPDGSLHYLAPVWGSGMTISADHALLLGTDGDSVAGGAVVNSIDPLSGAVTTLAGGGAIDVDWVPAAQTNLSEVRGVAVRPDGSGSHLYLVSYHRLRLIW